MTAHDSITTRESFDRMLANGLRGRVTMACTCGPTSIDVPPGATADSLLAALAEKRASTFPDCRHPVADRPADRR